MVFVAATLGQHVDHATESLSILRFKAAGFHLDFLNKIEVDAISQPGGAERIRITKPNFYRGHNCNPFLSNTDYALAITKTVEYWSSGAMA